jgi:putative transport protein
VREPFLALFLSLGFGHLLARVKIGSFALNSTAATLLVALVISALTSEVADLRFSIPPIVSTTAISLFLYAVGLRVGPQFLAGLRLEGFHLIVITLISATLNFLLAFWGSRLFHLDPGFAPGMISGGYNVTAAMGVATEAVTSGVYQPPAGMTGDQVMANIAAGYALTYIFSLLGIVALMTSLPRMFGIDPVASAKESEKKFGGSGHALPGTSAAFNLGLRPSDVRVYRLANRQFAGRPVHDIFATLDTPVLKLTRGGEIVRLASNPPLEMGDLLTVGGRLEKLVAESARIGPEVADEDARHLEYDQAEIVLTRKEMCDITLEELHQRPAVYGVRLRALFREGHELPVLPGTQVRKHDVLRVIGPTAAVDRAVKGLGEGVRPTEATQIVTLALGAAFGYMLGLISVKVGGIPIGLGTPAGLIIAGVTVATLRTINPLFGGPVPEATRSFIENIGLDLFVGALGLNVAPSLVAALTQGWNVVLVVAIGMVAALVPPFVAWLVGLYLFKMDPMVLAGAVAGARSSTTAMKALQDESKSAVPAFGYPVPYALSAIIVLIFAYLSLVLY